MRLLLLLSCLGFILLPTPLYICAQEADTIALAEVGVMAEKPDTAKTLTRKERRLLKRLERSIEENFDNTDDNWIEPNLYNYQFTLQNTNFFQQYHIRARSEGDEQRITFKPDGALRVGPYFGWRWLVFGYTFDVSRPGRAGKQSEMNLSLYSSRVGIDFVYVRNHGNFTIDAVSGFDPVKSHDVKGLEFDGLSASTLTLNAYYVFNHKHFSYPAAFSQSTVQRRSSGSWMLGLRYENQESHFDHTKLPLALRGDDDSRIIEPLRSTGYNYRNYNISVGYGYNWVFARNMLFAVSVMPSAGYRLSKGERLGSLEDGTKKVWMDVKNLNLDMVSRLGLVWNTSRSYAGVSFINYLFNYRNNNFNVTNTIFYLNIYAGINFWKKEKHRKEGERKW